MRKLETYWWVQTFEISLTSFSLFQAQGGVGPHSRPTYQVCIAAMVTLTCRIPYSDGRRGYMGGEKKKKGAGCSGHAFNIGKGHLYLPADKV